MQLGFLYSFLRFCRSLLRCACDENYKPLYSMQVGKRGAENRGKSNMYISPLYLISFVKIYKIYPLLLSHGIPSGWKKEILGFFSQQAWRYRIWTHSNRFQNKYMKKKKRRRHFGLNNHLLRFHFQHMFYRFSSRLQTVTAGRKMFLSLMLFVSGGKR